MIHRRKYKNVLALLSSSLLSLLLLATLGANFVFCQDKFVPIPNEIVSQYHFDFARNFFASPVIEKAKRAEYYSVLKNLERLKGKATASAANLLNALELRDAAEVEFLKHYNYLYLRNAINLKDEQSAAESSEMDAEFSRRTAFLRQELIGLNAKIIERFLRQKPALKIYLFAVESAQRYQPHTLSLPAEEDLSEMSPATSEWQFDLYLNLLQRTNFGKIKTADGDFDVRKQRVVIANSPDRTIRETGFKKLYEGYASQRDLYAFTLIRLVKARNRLAQLHRFEDASEEVYFKNYRTRAEVKNLLEKVAQFAGIYKRYQRDKAEYVKRTLGFADVNIWDLSAPTNKLAPRFTINEASRDILEALSPLGAEYNRELAALLDPANGRMDIVPGKDRKYSGFSSDFPGGKTVFYSGGFEGYYNDVRVLAHESTHAIQRQLMMNNRVPPAYIEGPHYLSESYAIFSELLLPDYLAERETDTAKKRYFLEQFFDGKGMAMFFVAPDAALEQAIFEGVEQNKIETADDLDALTKQINSRFSIWSDKHDELKMRWMSNSLMYEDPLYDINYVYGSLLALKYYEMFKRDPKNFAPRYIALLKNGFNAPPELLLKKFLDIDLRDPNLVPDAVRLLENKVSQLEQIYAEQSEVKGR